jgi:hypothetical protein
VHAQPLLPQKFTLMQWGAACGHPSAANLTKPHRVWEEDDKLTAELASKLLAQQQKLDETVRAQRRNARIEGTIEWKHMQRVNKAIQEHNDSIPRGQRKGQKRKRKVESEYPFQEFDKDTRKGGLDFCWYAFEVYEKELIPYYTKIAELNPGKRVVILEDSATPHVKARRLLKAELEEKGIEFIKWAAISPDLHPIEDIQKHHKNLLDELRFDVTSASKATKQRAKDKMKDMWQRHAGFTKIVEEVGSVSNYMRLGALCKAHKGNNNFKA